MAVILLPAFCLFLSEEMNKLPFKKWNSYIQRASESMVSLNPQKCLVCNFLSISISHKQTHVKFNSLR